MTPIEEWNQYFTEKFPNGVLVTLVRGNEASAHVDDSAQVRTSQIQVMEVEDDYPTIMFIDPFNGRNYIFEVSAVEERENGCFLETSSDTTPDLLLSANVEAD